MTGPDDDDADDFGFHDDEVDGPELGDDVGDADGDADDDAWPDDPVQRLRDLTGDDPRIQAGVDHLQRAAREVIAASRALLDVAEDLVDDPRGVGGLMGILGSVGDLASRLGQAPGRRAPWDARHDDDDDDGDDPPVQRIPVS